MLRPGVTQEWVDEGDLPRERTKSRRWRRPYDVELDCFSAHIRLREPGKSEDNAESATMLQKQIYQSRRKRCKCKAMDSRAMGLATPWYRRGGTSVESSIPCSHGGRVLVIKGAE
ncbi:hypothetical protein B296_00011269 [Ensete ventricosum]|uniref:Uncharacterized protein n=1 Tax=Ensete ventricosum TaxID=4639 RepID=A0A426Y5J0_ENSVE|nr:hypothetical protein B296_00011269 [Ensete ventricosum]